MDKEEFIQRAAISALPELIRIEEAQQRLVYGEQYDAMRMVIQ